MWYAPFDIGSLVISCEVFFGLFSIAILLAVFYNVGYQYD